MRALNCVWLSVAACALPALAGPNPSSDLTIVLDFKGPHSIRSVAGMRQETEAIMKDSGLRLDWRMSDEATNDTYPDLVVIRFKGSCVLERDPNIYDELGPPGPLAFTYTTDGLVQPFSDVSCDKVAASVRSAMWGGDFGRADQLLGRALGRVLAHELVHMLTRSGEHGHQGVAEPVLTGRQLIAESLPLSAADLARLRREYKGH